MFLGGPMDPCGIRAWQDVGEGLYTLSIGIFYQKTQNLGHYRQQPGRMVIVVVGVASSLGSLESLEACSDFTSLSSSMDAEGLGAQKTFTQAQRRLRLPWSACGPPCPGPSMGPSIQVMRPKGLGAHGPRAQGPTGLYAWARFGPTPV